MSIMSIQVFDSSGGHIADLYYSGSFPARSESLPVINMIDEKMPRNLHQETGFVICLTILGGHYCILRVFHWACWVTMYLMVMLGCFAVLVQSLTVHTKYMWYMFGSCCTELVQFWYNLSTKLTNMLRGWFKHVSTSCLDFGV